MYGAARDWKKECPENGRNVELINFLSAHMLMMTMFSGRFTKPASSPGTGESMKKLIPSHLWPQLSMMALCRALGSQGRSGEGRSSCRERTRAHVNKELKKMWGRCWRAAQNPRGRAGERTGRRAGDSGGESTPGRAGGEGLQTKTRKGREERGQGQVSAHYDDGGHQGRPGTLTICV